MSGEESILARWSRRKREAAKPRDTEPDQSPTSRSVTAESPQLQQSGSLPPLESASESSFDLSKLPPLDSITAETDLAAFLAPGVPTELRHAALRRAWSADPAIRDFVGLTENDWDVLAPAAAAGVKPLSVTEEMRQWADDLFTPPPADSAVSETAGQSAANARKPARDTSCESDAAGLDPEPVSLPPQTEEGAPHVPESGRNHAAAEHHEGAEAHSNGAPQPRPHGRALPR